MRRLILGTAGHIDHGKTTLIRALTGVDTDRLPDEKRRGITIDLGFARFALDDEIELGVVDVPGHEGLIRNMVAGATGIDLVLLVVAADEGVMPQTREHLAIVELLGIEAGVVALTKTDLVESEWLDLVVDDLGDRLAGTPFEAAPVVPVSAEQGTGLDALRTALVRTAANVGHRQTDDCFRMPIDRSFTVRGTGTVVTGTVWSGRLEADAGVRIVPEDIESRVRGLQVHGSAVDSVGAGERAAIALAGIDRDALGRGDAVVADEGWPSTRMLTVRLRLLSDTDWSVEARQRVRLHLGTAEVMARVVPLDRHAFAPGDTGWAQLRLERRITARSGDPFVIRSYSPLTTIGGGRVVEPRPRKRKRVDAETARMLADLLDASAPEAVQARATMAGWPGVAADALRFETPHRPEEVARALESPPAESGIARAGERILTREIAERARIRILESVDGFHERHPLRPGVDWETVRRALPEYAAPGLADRMLAALLDDGVLERRGDLVARTGFRARPGGGQMEALNEVRELYAEAGLTPPATDELPTHLREREDVDDLLALLVHQDELVALEPDRLIAGAALDDAIRRIRTELGGRDGLGPADFRVAVDLSRKYLMPILAHLDRIGVTARHGDGRRVAKVD